MAPGMQILVARKEKLSIRSRLDIRLMKRRQTSHTDLYDVASLTKILSTLPNVMLQYDQQNIKMETTLGSMLPIFKNSNKQDIHFKELSHYARLQPWIPFYKATCR
jgi:hypothetical protein